MPRHWCFNSTTVQLILISQSATAEEPLFQFHNGTINTADGTTTAIQQRTFQFHNGTINTFTLYCISSSVLVFQFHNGTINTIFFFDSVIGILCFNSTTVQLILCDFIACGDPPEFQFHNGTINTIVLLILLFLKCSFNSTTVQLIPSGTNMCIMSSIVSIPQRYN